MTVTVKNTLKTYWGASDFRTGQYEAVSAVLDRRDCLVVLPTGGGKSLCYQLPALVLPGVCVVISPLIALMSDQVEGLQKKGIRAMHLSGPMQEDDLVRALDNCKFGNFKFLYLSPERAQHPLVQAHLSQMQLSLLAIDEAHCISEWGHDFRPAYREIISLKNLLTDIPTIAVTATATADVREDICKTLELQAPEKIIGSFDRPNIELRVASNSNKLDAISAALEPKGLPSIVYVGTRKSAELLSNHLNNMGHKSAFFHGGATEKEWRIANWMQEKTPVMVATTAFGMGIDKANVKRVVHATLPFSMEQYYQEVGRCGRDGNTSTATLFVGPEDQRKLWDRLMASVPPRDAIQKTYKYLCLYFDIAYGELPQELLEFNLNLFCKRYDVNPKTTFHVLELLQRGQVLSLTQYNTPKTSLKLEINSNPKSNILIDYLLRNIGGITESMQSVNLYDAAKKCNLPLQQCIALLKKMEQNGTANIQQLHVDSAIQFLSPREDNITLRNVLKQMDTFKREKKRLADSVWEYCTTTKCHRKKLLNYFGEKTKNRCESCSNCMKNNTSIREVIQELKKILTNGETVSLNQLVIESKFGREHVIDGLGFLVDEEIIVQEKINFYRLK
ncbi:MAG: RecQ family ATP-dependent DNA helicase [Bacteroidetes bacterium]|nr:RecQ family ATP-dependent DNA helicase [Bacteroidota bacterium]MDA0888349.1 RecQ family ATP-dependent DNA helicase [Bacteroidota bacterium]MDA1084666.1 RecQ family ATP-dependent DNA helicase [Bacteroidota bacterium]